MGIRPRSHRRGLQSRDWPQVDERVLGEVDRKCYRLRRDALQAYLNGAPLADIESMGINRRTLYRLLARALKPHDDGRVWGWRALAPQVRVKSYERHSAPKVLVNTKAGNAGAFR